jgi:hypothetical protein
MMLTVHVARVEDKETTKSLPINLRATHLEVTSTQERSVLVSAVFSAEEAAGDRSSREAHAAANFGLVPEAGTMALSNC